MALRDLPIPIDTPTVRRIAVDADADPRTVVRVLAGGRVSGGVADRIRRAYARHGVPTPDACAPRMVADTPDHRERCAECGRAYEAHVRYVVRALGDGRSWHLACAPSEVRP